MSEERPAFIVHFRPQARIDGVKALRALLKAALRRFGLRAVYVTEVKPTDEPEMPGGANTP
jgi:hypothetical protein